MLEKGKGDQGQERVPVEPCPGAALEVVEPEPTASVCQGGSATIGAVKAMRFEPGRGSA
jgi:hypothetical protein